MNFKMASFKNLAKVFKVKEKQPNEMHIEDYLF